MDRRGFLLFGAAGVSAGVSSWFPPIEATTEVVGQTSEASGLLSLAALGDREPSYFDPESITATGTGDETFQFESRGGFTMVQADGTEEVALSVDERTVETHDEAEFVAGYPLARATYTVSVRASGDWELTLAQPQSQQEAVRESPARAVGSGDVIVGPLDTSTDTLISAQHNGDGPFTVSLGLESSTGVFGPETLFDTTGAVEESVETGMAGVAWIVVSARDSWMLTFERGL